jgi:hypothetical protein
VLDPNLLNAQPVPPRFFDSAEFIAYSVLMMLSLLLNAITMPFWQATKAALYYSLRSRREGFDLQLRSPDRP